MKAHRQTINQPREAGPANREARFGRSGRRLLTLATVVIATAFLNACSGNFDGVLRTADGVDRYVPGLTSP